MKARICIPVWLKGLLRTGDEFSDNDFHNEK